MCDNLNLPIALLADLHGIAEVAHSVVDLYLVVQELLESGDVEDLIGGGLGGINNELLSRALVLCLAFG